MKGSRRYDKRSKRLEWSKKGVRTQGMQVTLDKARKQNPGT